jgi:cytochrome P450
MTQYMLRVTSSILFGFDRPELAYEIGRRTERWVAMNHELGMGAFISDPEITSSYPRLLALAEDLETLIRSMIALRRASATPGRDVLSLLLHAQDEDGVGLSDTELVGQAAILFAAAHLTTSYTLTWTLFLLAQHPTVAADLADELAGVLKGEVPTVRQLDELPFLDRVIKESMRVLPASSYSQRLNVEPVELGPFRLPAGQPIIFSQYITHHMPDLFPEPERFLPERWETIHPSPYAYIPFATGPRMCLGGPLAGMILRLTLPAILQRFHPRVVPGSTISGQVTSTMLKPTRGMPMVMLPANAPFAAVPVSGNVHRMVFLDADRRASIPV